MYTVSFDCTVTTPMFLAGADQSSCEFRAASIRGALRYWYRALLGGMGYGAETTNEAATLSLMDKEAALFGKAEVASPLLVRVIPVGHSEKQRAKNILEQAGNLGVSYLWYSTTLGDNNRMAFMPGTRFRVNLTVLKDPQLLQEAVCAFWMLANLGGLGTRSRRGAGSFEAHLVEQPEGLKLPAFTRNAAASDWGYREALRFIQTLFPAVSATQPPEFDSLLPGYAHVWRARLECKSPMEAAAGIGDLFKNFRSTRGKHNEGGDEGRDYKPIRNFLLDRNNVPDTVERASFGLPLTFNFSTDPEVADVAEVTAGNYTRRASPLWIRVSKLEKNTYDAVLTFFDSRFLPGDKIKIDDIEIRAPQESLVPTFIETALDNAVRVYPI